LNVNLIAHTVMSRDFIEKSENPFAERILTDDGVINQRAAVALTAIRTCYSPLKPSEILHEEGGKYFGNAATDGGKGTDADRLFRQIVRSKHTSTLEHITYTFAVEGVSRALLSQLTRHRQFSFSVQSQRYVKFGSVDKSGGFDYVAPPPSLEGKRTPVDQYSSQRPMSATELYEDFMVDAQYYYDALRSAGVPAEDARYVLPNATTCNLVTTGNLRAFLEFYGKRRAGNGAQWEIADLAERFREEITKVDEWVAPFFVKEDEQ